MYGAHMMPRRPLHGRPMIPRWLRVTDLFREQGKPAATASRTLASMTLRRTPRSLVTVAALVFSTSACERGCLGRWLSERGVGGETPEGSGGAAPQGKTRTLDLTGTDCSDGLLRCRDGRVEASRTAHLPHPCGAARSGERQVACECPWDVVAACPSGCASEGLEVLGAPDAGVVDALCRPDEPVARPILPGDPIPSEICAREGVACVDGSVRICEAPGQPVRLLARCLEGCQPHVGIDVDPGIETEPGASTNLDGLASILCRRRHAERR